MNSYYGSKTKQYYDKKAAYEFIKFLLKRNFDESEILEQSKKLYALITIEDIKKIQEELMENN